MTAMAPTTEKTTWEKILLRLLGSSLEDATAVSLPFLHLRRDATGIDKYLSLRGGCLLLNSVRNSCRGLWRRA